MGTSPFQPHTPFSWSHSFHTNWARMVFIIFTHQEENFMVFLFHRKKKNRDEHADQSVPIIVYMPLVSNVQFDPKFDPSTEAKVKFTEFVYAKKTFDKLKVSPPSLLSSHWNFWNSPPPSTTHPLMRKKAHACGAREGKPLSPPFCWKVKEYKMSPPPQCKLFFFTDLVLFCFYRILRKWTSWTMWKIFGLFCAALSEIKKKNGKQKCPLLLRSPVSPASPAAGKNPKNRHDHRQLPLGSGEGKKWKRTIGGGEAGVNKIKSMHFFW